MRATRTLTKLAMMAAVLTALWMPAGAGDASLSYYTHRTNGIGVHVVDVDLHDQSLQITPAFARNALGARRPFTDFLIVSHPLAQITGGYFDLISGYPVGDAVIDSKRFYDGPVGSALAMTAENRAAIIDVPPKVLYNWPGYEDVLQGGIRLVKQGAFAVFPYDQGFRDPALFRPASRTAVGLTAQDHLLLVATSREIYLSQLAYIMLDLGCRDAMSLDGGVSTGLAFGDSVILRPGRTLPVVLQVVRRVLPTAVTPNDASKVRKPADWSIVPAPDDQPGVPDMLANPYANPTYRRETPGSPPPADVDMTPALPLGVPSPMSGTATSPAILQAVQDEPQRRSQGKRRIVERNEAARYSGSLAGERYR